MSFNQVLSCAMYFTFINSISIKVCNTKYDTKFVDLKAREDLSTDEKMNESMSVLLQSWTNLCTNLFKG